MSPDRHNLFLSANRELRSFLERVDGLVHGTSEVGVDDLRALGRLLDSMAPEIDEASRGVSADALLQAQIQQYISNLRTLQVSLEQVQCVMLARRAQLEAARQHLDGLQGWVDAYRQTA